MFVNFINKAFEAIKKLVESLKIFFENFRSKYSNILKDLKDSIKDVQYKKRRSYPHKLPRYVDRVNFHRLNKRGYPRPITLCARSRC